MLNPIAPPYSIKAKREVSSRLQGRSNTAPGLDGIASSDLLKAAELRRCSRTLQRCAAYGTLSIFVEGVDHHTPPQERGRTPAEQLEANLPRGYMPEVVRCPTGRQGERVVRGERAVQQVAEGLPSVRRVLRA